eukprot:923872_1
MPGILDKIKEIEDEMAKTQKNKATNYHLGLLKGKIARLRTQLIEGNNKSAPKGEGFDVLKSGDARVALIGFPSVGKSTLLNKLTNTESQAASYEFTTLTCIPGVIQYNDANIQLLDLPGIIEGASEGKGRGRQVIAVARTADIIFMMMNAANGPKQQRLLTKELEAVGLRLNERPPDIAFKLKKAGGVHFTTTVPLTEMDERLCKLILHDYKIHNATVLFREDVGARELIDAIEGNRIYVPCVYAFNMIDNITLEEVDQLARRPHSIVLSAGKEMNLDKVLEKIWEYLCLVRVFTKPKGEAPDLSDPLVMRTGATIEHVCHGIHRDLIKKFKYALVWGKSAKHRPQRVGLHHLVVDEDVVQV